jgi:hypothetical protein
MIAAVNVSSGEELQIRFLGILSRIEQHARIAFRHVACREKRADLVAEAVALSWKWFARLAEKGKDAAQFPTVLASFAAKAVASGRRVCGQLRATDALSERAQQRHGFVVGKLPDFSTESSNPLAEALIDNTRTPVPDAAAFRVDFPRWKRRYRRRERRLIGQLMVGERTKDVARRFHLSPARVSQLRQQFRDDWTGFCGG